MEAEAGNDELGGLTRMTDSVKVALLLIIYAGGTPAVRIAGVPPAEESIRR